MSGKLGGFSWTFTQERRTGEGCGPFREKQACRFSVNILFVCLFVCFVDLGDEEVDRDLEAREYARLNNRSKNQEREFVWKYYNDKRVLDMAVYTWMKMLSEDRTLSLKEPSSERSSMERKLQPLVGMRPYR